MPRTGEFDIGDTHFGCAVHWCYLAAERFGKQLVAQTDPEIGLALIKNPAPNCGFLGAQPG